MIKSYWAVMWTRKAVKEWQITPGIIHSNIVDEYKVKCRCHPKKWHWISSLAIFETKKEAVAYRDGNEDFMVQKLTVGWSEKVK